MKENCLVHYFCHAHLARQYGGLWSGATHDSEMRTNSPGHGTHQANHHSCSTKMCIHPKLWDLRQKSRIFLAKMEE